MEASQLSQLEIDEAQKVFSEFDKNKDGHISSSELKTVLTNLKMTVDDATCTKLMQEADKDKNGTIEWNEFLVIVKELKSGKTSDFGKVVKGQKELMQVSGASGGVHSFAQEEIAAFTEHINNCLGKDPELAYLLPINPNSQDLLTKVYDGVLLCKFINLAVPGTIDERALNKRKGKQDLIVFQINENQNLCISAAKSIGVQTVNLGAAELQRGKEYPHLVLGLIWQLVKIQLLNSINLKAHPELFRLLEEGEELADLLKLPPEQLLLRWFNYHLKNAKHPRRVKNFGPDVKDAECYTVLLHQIAPQRCGNEGLQENNLEKRSGMVIDNAKKLEVPTFIQPRDIVNGNSRLNLAFTASIFNTCPGLDPLTEKEKSDLAGMMDDDYGDSREERAFRMWINSLGIQDVYVHSLFEDCRDGLILLKIMDHIWPGIVAWNKVEMKPNNKFKKVSNTNYVVVLAKQQKLSMVNIGGSDLTDGNKKLTLGLVWQLMRAHIIKFLGTLPGKEGKPITDDDIVAWANLKVKQTGGQHTMSSFKDKSLRDSLFFFDLLSAVNKNIINKEIITKGATDEEALNNAKYAISVARKLGCVIFLLPEDIVEIKDKMIMTFVAAVMQVDMKGGKH